MSLVLLVDDDEDLREIVTAGLRFYGFDVTAVATATEALALLRDGTRPCVVIVDYLIPGEMSGRELVVELARTSLPVVVWTALPPRSVQLPPGVDLLLKPVDLDALARLCAERCGTGDATPIAGAG